MTGEENSESTHERADAERRHPRHRNAPGARQPVPIGIDSTGTAPDPIHGERRAPSMTALPPEVLPRLISTQTAYRQLVSSGLTGTEAAGLIGFVSGLAPNTTPWTMSQVNRLLFLRSLYRDGEWGRAERRADP
jgi:hypothetical protein